MAQRLFPLALALLFSAGFVGAAPLGTAFIYQGRLTDAGAPANGVYDFQLILYDAAVGGSQFGPIVTRDDVAVANGVFTTSLDFGAAFTGSQRWLDIGVRPGASTGAYNILSPRQEVTPAPNALYAQNAANAANAATIAGLTCTNGQVAKWSGAGWTCGADVDTNTTYLAAAGGALTLAGTAFAVDNTVVARKDSGAGNQAFDTATLFLDYVNNRVGIGTATPVGPLDVAGGTALNDFPGLAINVRGQNGGADGADVDSFGGQGGNISVTGGTGGPTRTGGSVDVSGGTGGAAVATASSGSGGLVALLPGDGGSSVFAAIPGGNGGQVQIYAGNGGNNFAGVGGSGGTIYVRAGGGAPTSGAGGELQFDAGAGSGAGNGGLVSIDAGDAPNSGSGGNLMLTSGSSISGPGGDVTILAGMSQTGAAGEILLQAGGTTSGTVGAIKLGGTTPAPNSTAQGTIRVHVVGGDINVTGAGDGIILRSPNGLVCRLLSIDNAGATVLTAVTCP